MTLEQRIADYLAYTPETGVLHWKKAFHKPRIGTVAGGYHASSGYIRVGFEGAHYMAHRLAFLLMTGRWPDCLIDHINRNRLDNRWSNLREADYSLNSRNTSPSRKSASGLLGVSKTKRGKWQAAIRNGGNPVYLGLYSTPEEAHAAYMAAKSALHR